MSDLSRGAQTPLGGQGSAEGRYGPGRTPSVGGSDDRSRSVDAVVPRPRTVALAVQLMRLGALLSALSGVIAFAQRDGLRRITEETYRAQGWDATAGDLDSAVTVSILTTAVCGLVGAAVWLWLARATGTGKPWSRIVATGLLAAAALSLAWGLTLPTPGVLTTVVTVASIVGCAVAAVLLWKPDSSHFFTAGRRS